MDAKEDGQELRLSAGAYAALALISGSIIAYELFVMRVFSNGGWSHFGSTVVSIAMFGFGVFSTALCIWKKRFENRLSFWVNISLLLLGPLMTAVNGAAQGISFNPIFLVSDPNQKYYLAGYFLLYFVPFLFGAAFIGLFFLAGKDRFGRVYFANMSGSGLGGLILFFGLYFLFPKDLYLVPLLLWAAGGTCWFLSQGRRMMLICLAASFILSLGLGLALPQVEVSQYKGVSYARNFPDAKRVHEATGPFGYLEVYSSSYFHFAPGLSDVAAMYLEEMPKEAYLGLYIDGDGPIGIMKDLPAKQTEYFRFLPLSMPYLLLENPKVLVLQFGGGISTNVALRMGAEAVTVAEGNPLIVETIKDSPVVSNFTGKILEKDRVHLVETEGRIYARQVENEFDLVDISLADSTGLSMPGGYSIHENYSYTKETFASCLKALKPEGLLAVTVWNKEDPPKSTFRLISTMALAARDSGAKDLKQNFFMAQTFLSTFTALYKKNGFTTEEVKKLKDYCHKMSFDIVYYPGRPEVTEHVDEVFEAYRNVYFDPEKVDNLDPDVDMSAGNLYRIAADRFIGGQAAQVERDYVFRVPPLTDDQPYFAGFVKLGDILKFRGQWEVISDEWGYLLLWATLAVSICCGMVLMLIPVAFGWRAVFSKHRGKVGIFLYFSCLGLGYIIIEIGLIGKYMLILGNPTVSVAVLITGMLIFSGLGSYLSERFVSRAGAALPAVCVGVAAILLIYVFGLDGLLNVAGGWPYGARIIYCLALLFPLAFLLGFPFALGMSTLAGLKKDVFFVWAWGINGSFSVAGSVLVPILAVNLGLSSVLLCSAFIYLAALPCFFFLRLPDAAG